MTPAQFRKAVIDRDVSCRLRHEGCQGVGHHVHHIFGKRFKATVCDPDNGIFLCFSCHDWVHKHIAKFQEKLKEWHGEEWFEELERKAKGGVK